ncbi:SRPBCC family protein [Nocardia sp. NPDC003963]
MAEIDVVQQFPVSAAQLWARVGDPGAVADWIPAISESRMDGDIRHVVFTDGNPARERIVEHRDADRRYTYRYIDGPLALDFYESTIEVAESADGTSEIRWWAEFSAETEAVESALATAIESIYTGALAELAGLLARS